MKKTDRILRIILASLSLTVFIASSFIKTGLLSHALLRMFLVLASLGVFLLTAIPKKLRPVLYRHRFLIALGVFLVLVALGINGSSFGYWHFLFDDGVNTELLGVSRGVRSDEWALFTPMSQAQYLNPNGKFSYLNPIFGGVDTDMFLIYGQPVLDIGTVFRPFFWGFLFLPVNNGLAWFWCGRLIALFMVSFEFGMMLTDGKKTYALCYALLLALSPFVQWWFAINGLVEMILYVELALLLLRRYLGSPSLVIRSIAMAGILCCAGGFLLTVYPAWMIPIFYVLLALAVALILRHRKEAQLKAADLFIAVGLFLAVAAVLAHVFLKSKDFIALTMHTAFPGKRVSSGGAAMPLLSQYAASVFYPFQGLIDTGLSNTSELSQVICFAPLPEILAVTAMVRNRKADGTIIALLSLDVFFLVYAVIGLPAVVSKVLLLNFTTSYRVVPVITLVELILLIRSVGVSDRRYRLIAALPLGIGSAIAVFTYLFLMDDMFTSKAIMIGGCMVFAVFMVLWIASVGRKRLQCLLTLSILLLSVMAGGLVNPIRSGIKDVTESETVQAIRSVNEAEEGLFAVTETYPESNVAALAGARTLNATNLYPNLKTWQSLDPSGESEEIYNRYAHIRIVLQKTGQPFFTLDSPDSFTVTMTVSDLRRLGVRYVLERSASGILTEENAEFLRTAGPYSIYRLK